MNLEKTSRISNISTGDSLLPFNSELDYSHYCLYLLQFGRQLRMESAARRIHRLHTSPLKKATGMTGMMTTTKSERPLRRRRRNWLADWLTSNSRRRTARRYYSSPDTFAFRTQFCNLPRRQKNRKYMATADTLNSSNLPASAVVAASQLSPLCWLNCSAAFKGSR